MLDDGTCYEGDQLIGVTRSHRIPVRLLIELVFELHLILVPVRTFSTVFKGARSAPRALTAAHAKAPRETVT
jgi:hypothetical protein